MYRRIYPVPKPLRQIFGIVILVALIGTIFSWGQNIYAAIRDTRFVPSPLTQNELHDLCSNFEMADTDPICAPEAQVYLEDFLLVIKSAFQSESGYWATYNDVQDKLGDFEAKCTENPMNPDGSVDYTCHYYFNVQGGYDTMVITFNEEDGMLSITLLER